MPLPAHGQRAAGRGRLSEGMASSGTDLQLFSFKKSSSPSRTKPLGAAPSHEGVQTPRECKEGERGDPSTYMAMSAASCECCSKISFSLTCRRDCGANSEASGK